jgi:hypothetical protein
VASRDGDGDENAGERALAHGARIARQPAVRRD